MRTKETAGLLVCALLAASALAPARAAALGAGVPTAGSVSAPSVARLSVIADGTVSITHGADATKVDATVNAPLLAGDGFATTGADVRAEIQLDGLTILRLGPGVRGRIASNDVRTRVIEIDAGLVELALLRGSDTATEIVTPALTVRTRYAGNYRVNVTADGSTTVAARSGQTDAITPSKTYTLVAGQTLEAPAGAAVAIRSSVARDPFDEFNDARDRTLLAALDGDSHLPASIAGYDDLNAYGQWTDVASYGEAWVPKQDANWAPYRDGQWTDTSGYGMTWVGSEPWGWVPYHYGRWFFVRRFGWCWYPPRFTTLPIWAPGLVGFFGSGYGPFGYSTLGWVPLAPFETYYPWYPWQWYAFRGQAVRSHPAPPKRMQPLATAFRNARFGGASVLGAAAWHAGNFAHPAAVDSTRLSTVTLVRGHLPMLPDRPLAPASTRSALTEMSAQPSWQSEFQHAASILTLPGLPALPAQSVPIRATAPGMRLSAPHSSPVVRDPSPGMHAPLPVTHQPLPLPMPHELPVMHESPPVMHAAPIDHSGSHPPA